VVDGRSVAQVEPDKKREVRVRINGDLVARTPRPKVDKTRTNDDIRWLLVHAAGELGEQGMAIDPAGGGSRNPANTGPLHDRRLDSMPSVHRWRRRWAVWCALTDDSRRTLRSRYRDEERQHSEVRGLRAVFADLASLAWDLADDRDDLRERLSRGGSKRDQVVEGLRRKAEAVNRAAHLEWLEAERRQAMDAECPPRSAS
jgi:hypothetical protein